MKQLIEIKGNRGPRTFERWRTIDQQPALLAEVTGNNVLMHVPEIDGKTLERLERLHDPPHW